MFKLFKEFFNGKEYVIVKEDVKYMLVRGKVFVSTR